MVEKLKQISSAKQSKMWGDPLRLVHYLARLMKDKRVPKTAKLKVVGAGLYAWIDGDLVPDPIKFIPGLGFVDDIILVVHGIKCLIAETESAVAVELWPGDEASFERTMKAVKWLDDQLYGRVRKGFRWVIDKATGKKPGMATATPSDGR